MTYVLMTKLSTSALRDPRGLRTTGRDWMRKIKEACPDVVWRAHYALLGPYDFLDIFEAPDEKSAFRVALLSRELGAVRASSWPAMQYDAFLEMADAVSLHGHP